MTTFNMRSSFYFESMLKTVRPLLELPLNEVTYYLPIKDLQNKWVYFINARNSNIGIWLKDRLSFLISRFKFGDNYLFEELHYDADEHFGTAKPLAAIQLSPYTFAGQMTDKNESLFYREEDKIRKFLNNLDKKYLSTS